MIYGYIRVSTGKQSLDNQRIEIDGFCRRNHLHIDKWIDEVISGTKAPAQRKLGRLMKSVRPGDIVICTELSRLGRSLMMIMNVLSIFLDRKIKVWTVKDNFRLGDDIQSKVLAFAFGISAEIERQLISERTKNGLQRARLEGKHIGRKPGSTASRYKLTGRDDDIIRAFENGLSKNRISKSLGVSWQTLDKYCKRCGIASPQGKHD
ncbi:MAG: master DNA invertase Mpi family serine-type recombinase [Bacteroides sp.]|nr:master DNA invertase Mpi family serine-type recombinase [Prevotella sp.]MCM1408608.1 master DNA invertase Mpi family serine-type recombinase [Treponema brennaborense]MCM1468904.1 master DNA invertase Mpi family serine-type recombinase [Bacteroides sp.]